MCCIQATAAMVSGLAARQGGSSPSKRNDRARSAALTHALGGFLGGGANSGQAASGEVGPVHMLGERGARTSCLGYI